MTHDIQHQNGHTIVCGFGRMGQTLAEQLRRNKQPLVVVEREPKRFALAQSLGYLALNGDATEEGILQAAGIERAKCVVVTLPNDAASVFITLTVPQSESQFADHRPRRAAQHAEETGAGGRGSRGAAGHDRRLRIAAMITHPATVDLFELAAGPKTMDVEVNEWVVPAASSLVGKSVESVEAWRKHRLLVVAARHAEGNLIFNPDADFVFAVGDTIIVMGRPDDLTRFRHEQEV